MERFFKKIGAGVSSSNEPNIRESIEKRSRIEVLLNLNDIASDPGLRKSIEEFDVSIRDQVRREYLTRGPCQPIGHIYPKSTYGNQERSFQNIWFQNFVWLEYSVSKDAVFCFWCYLFKQTEKGGRYGEEVFTKKGFRNWKRALDKFNDHVGDVNSCHNYARMQFESFKDQRHSVTNMFRENNREMDAAYRVRLTAALDVARLLLQQGLPFRGHDESNSSFNRGNFLVVIDWYSQRNEKVSKVLGKNAPGNNQMTCPQIQKDLAHACASEITSVILNDIGDKVFTILVDEARDVSMKEQMGVVLRYVNKEGCVVERFLAIVHVVDTCSHSLKDAIDALFAQHGLSLSKVRGQGYDDALNSFSQFNVSQLMRFAALYHEDFSAYDSFYLSQHLESFIVNVRCDPQFSAIDDLGSLSQVMVRTGKHLVFPLVYRMIELTLVLPVATASVERAFSAMKNVKTDLRNRMGDEWMNDSLIVYIEKEIFEAIDNEPILQYFQSMRSRRYQLPPL